MMWQTAALWIMIDILIGQSSATSAAVQHFNKTEATLC
jgi:hypothetical protein